jgi:hypothetical protein
VLSFCQQTEEKSTARSSTPLTTAMSITSTRLQEEEGEEGGRSQATDYAGSNEVLEDLGKEDCNYKDISVKISSVIQ